MKHFILRNIVYIGHNTFVGFATYSLWNLSFLRKFIFYFYHEFGQTFYFGYFQGEKIAFGKEAHIS